MTPEEFQKDVFRFFRRDENIVYVGEHNIEVFVQYNARQELLSEAVYDLLKDTWIKGPKIVPESYDPAEDFSDIFDDIRAQAGKADKELGELRRDIIDYDTITGAIKGMSGETQKRLVVKLQAKLSEIEADITDLKKTKLSWITLRRNSSLPVSEEEALEDIDLAKRWRDANATFKYLSRYRYMRIITVLEKLLSDNKIEPDEIDIMKSVMA